MEEIHRNHADIFTHLNTLTHRSFISKVRLCLPSQPPLCLPSASASPLCLPLKLTRRFISKEAHVTQEHYIKVVPTVLRDLGHKETRLYQYSAQHSYIPEDTGAKPSAMFRYDLQPMQVVVTQTKRSFADFLTSVCAIVGGVFTVFGLMDSMVYYGQRELVKQGIGKLS